MIAAGEGGTVLVTGASSGIGRAAAVALADAGYDVAAAMRRPKPLARADGRSIPVLPLDLEDGASIELFAGTALALGPLRALINTAGIPCLGAVEELPPARLRQAMQVNFFGTLQLCSAVSAALRRQGSGLIVNVSSSLAAAALPLYGGYCASKAALEAATEALHLELAPHGVSVRILRPGLVATAFGGKRSAQAPAADSPYAERLDNPEPDDLVAMISKPETVAAAIVQMVERPAGPFRVVVGADAERWVENRRRLDDEAFLRGVAEGGYPFR